MRYRPTISALHWGMGFHRWRFVAGEGNLDTSWRCADVSTGQLIAAAIGRPRCRAHRHPVAKQASSRNLTLTTGYANEDR
ncbi:MAG: hypothetical protein PHQ28_12335 [Mycobacterium sp.]|nr:hypothetical protein [Mycobacterium sp.]